MKHLIFIFHIVSFLSGFTALILSLFIYMKYQQRKIKIYLIFMMAFSALLVEQTITSYNLINYIDVKLLNAFLNIMAYLSASCIICFLPLLAHEVLNKIWSPKKKKVFLSLGILPLFCLGIYYVTDLNIWMHYIVSSLLFGTIVYTVCLIQKAYKTIDEEKIKKGLKRLLILTVVFIPYMYLDTKVEQIAFLRSYCPYGLLSLPLYYMLWNIMTIYYVLVYYKSMLNTASTIKEETTYVNFYETYNITAREKEIVTLILAGDSYNEIAEKLNISLPTVKTHIYHIYQKTNVKNKIQLLNLIKAN